MPIISRLALPLILIVGCVLLVSSWQMFQVGQSDQLNLKYTEARVAGRTYRWPSGKDSAVLPESRPGQGTNAVMPAAAWASLLNAAMPGKDVAELKSAPSIAIFIRQPQEPAWPIPLRDYRPPVQSAITADGLNNGVRYWRQTDSKVPGWNRYFTFSEADDVYGECSMDRSGVPRLCYGRWNDAGVIHTFGIRPDQVERLPEIVNWYRFVVTGKRAG